MRTRRCLIGLLSFLTVVYFSLPAWAGETVEFHGFILTREEHRILKPHEAFFKTRTYKVGDKEQHSGNCIAIWRDEEAVVEGGKEVKINWLIPESSRTRFAKERAKAPAVLFMLQCYTKDGSVVVSYAHLKKEEFASASGSFRIGTPPETAIEGAGRAFLLLLSDEGKPMNNIILIPLKYGKG